MTGKCPCKGCELRGINCHSACTPYIEWRDSFRREIGYQKEMINRAGDCINSHAQEHAYKWKHAK